MAVFPYLSEYVVSLLVWGGLLWHHPYLFQVSDGYRLGMTHSLITKLPVHLDRAGFYIGEGMNPLTSHPPF